MRLPLDSRLDLGIDRSERPTSVTLHSLETEPTPDKPKPANRNQGVIPFYGATDPELFAIERASMDRAGKVIRFLDETLPQSGFVLDIGAGDGFTAQALTAPPRTVVALEPSAGMVRPERPLPWYRGQAQALPFADASFGGAYATWAYFFHGYHDISPGLSEIRRVTKVGGPVVIVDNAGNDEFTELGGEKSVSDIDAWINLGFEVVYIDTAFEFETLDDARRLLGYFFGERGLNNVRLHVEFRVACFVSEGIGTAA